MLFTRSLPQALKHNVISSLKIDTFLFVETGFFNTCNSPRSFKPDCSLQVWLLKGFEAVRIVTTNGGYVGPQPTLQILEILAGKSKGQRDGKGFLIFIIFNILINPVK